MLDPHHIFMQSHIYPCKPLGRPPSLSARLVWPLGSWAFWRGVLVLRAVIYWKSTQKCAISMSLDLEWSWEFGKMIRINVTKIYHISPTLWYIVMLTPQQYIRNISTDILLDFLAILTQYYRDYFKNIAIYCPLLLICHRSKKNLIVTIKKVALFSSNW